MGMAEKG